MKEHSIFNGADHSSNIIQGIEFLKMGLTVPMHWRGVGLCCIENGRSVLEELHLCSPPNGRIDEPAPNLWVL